MTVSIDFVNRAGHKPAPFDQFWPRALALRAAQVFKAAGIELAYHNHDLEFARFGDLTFLEIIYDEADGLPEEGIAPGTRWADVPDDWTCPDCGVGKDDFEMVELD